MDKTFNINLGIRCRLLEEPHRQGEYFAARAEIQPITHDTGAFFRYALLVWTIPCQDDSLDADPDYRPLQEEGDEPDGIFFLFHPEEEPSIQWPPRMNVDL